MYTIISITFVLCLLQAVNSRPQHTTDPVPIVSQQLTFNPENGGYVNSFETGNGIKVNEQGDLRDVPNENGTGREPAIVVTGSYTYTHDGTTYTVTYTADENGFRPTGQHIAPEIIKALETIAAQSANPSASQVHPVYITPNFNNLKRK